MISLIILDKKIYKYFKIIIKLEQEKMEFKLFIKNKLQANFVKYINKLKIIYNLNANQQFRMKLSNL